MVKDAIIAAVNAVISALGAAMNAVIGAWPIGMPDLPSAPTELGEAFAWIRWSPLPVDAAFAFIVFLVTAWLAWSLVAPVLRWAKFID